MNNYMIGDLSFKYCNCHTYDFYVTRKEVGVRKWVTLYFWLSLFVCFTKTSKVLLTFFPTVQHFI